MTIQIDAARLRAERKADAELLLAPRDDERHDAVKTHRCQDCREQAEARGQERDQTIGQQVSSSCPSRVFIRYTGIAESSCFTSFRIARYRVADPIVPRT